MATVCYHCGDECREVIREDGREFCCNGCSQVYLLLRENQLCNYYDLDKNPGIKARGRFAGERFAYLDDPSLLPKLASFASEKQVHISFNLPQMHCASCVFLLENLHKIESGITRSEVNFPKKELFVSFDPTTTSLRKLVELLAFVGYEPYISLNDLERKRPRLINRKRLLELGVAGFAFANIMMLSFPEYFSGGEVTEPGLQQTFSYIIFLLSLPVLFFSARGFFASGFTGLRQGILNIDLPIVVAILITFGRSYYEILTQTGAGYLDSGTGIIFFMLIGRWFQDKTYDALSFDRDALSYFPLGVTVVRDGREKSVPVTQIRIEDEIIVRHGEMIPADSILLSGEAMIDYSFVTGESLPMQRHKNEIIHAGGKQCAGRISMRVMKEPSQSYLTRLWNHENWGEKHRQESFIHPWSRYFTMVLFSIAFVAAIYWYLEDPSIILPVVSSVLIIACPCSLLLTATFTFGNMTRILGRNKVFLKNAHVIESIAAIDTIVFDKTGTITRSDKSRVQYFGKALSEKEKNMIVGLSAQSSHVLSKSIVDFFSGKSTQQSIESFREISGKGIAAIIDREQVSLGSEMYAGASSMAADVNSPRVYARIGGESLGYFEIRNVYREGMEEMVGELKREDYDLHLLSGDNQAERIFLQEWFDHAKMKFNNSPEDKLDYVRNLVKRGRQVMMVGDGLNDAGALKMSKVGIAVHEQSGTFTPACDVIMDGSMVSRLHHVIRFATAGRRIIMAGFIISILYNVVGISFAVQGNLSPLVAAILMPISSISIVSLSTLLSAAVARRYGL